MAAYVHAGIDSSIEAVTRLGVSAVVLAGLVVVAALLGRRMRNPGLAPVVAMAASAGKVSAMPITTRRRDTFVGLPVRPAATSAEPVMASRSFSTIKAQGAASRDSDTDRG